jgi:hypothetical protein
MNYYPQSAGKRAMKMQEVILQARARKITWWQAGTERSVWAIAPMS